MASSGVSKFDTQLGCHSGQVLGVQAGGYRCTPALDSHRGELMTDGRHWSIQ